MKLKRKFKSILIIIIMVTFVIVGVSNSLKKDKIADSSNENSTTPSQENNLVTIKISAVGDCTLASDSTVGESGWNNFNSYLKNGDYGYYFKGVYDILSDDDLTIANLEGTFTEATEKAVKTFNFKNSRDYVKVLTEGSIEIVNTANNHTYDYKEQGYKDTIETLNNAKIPYFGYTDYKVLEIKGVKIGFAGFNYYDERNYENYKKEVDAALSYLKKQEVDLIITSFHWGIEATYNQTAKQTEVAHYAIDNGSDLVLGHHPHRIQGIEYYKDKYIVYSLSNFVFGGHRNPSDKDSFIWQQTFTFKDKKLEQDSIKIYPVRISGKDDINNYQPIKATNKEDIDRIKKKINQYSVNFTY